MGVFSRFSFRKKLTAIVLCTAVVALLFAAAIFSLLEVFSFKQNLEYQASLFTDIVATSTTPALAMKIPYEADALLKTLVSDPHVTAVFLFDENGKPFAQYLRSVKNTNTGQNFFSRCDLLNESNLPVRDARCFSWDHLGVFRFVYLDGKKVGSVYLQSDLELLYSRLRTAALSLLALLMHASLIAFLVAYPLQRIVTRPVLHLVERIRQVSENDNFTVRAEKFSEDEIGVLTDGFNEMLDHLEDHRNALFEYQEELERKVHERTLDLQEKNRELLLAKKAAESSSLAKSSFLANISHELRTPLVGVLGIAEVLMESDLTQRQRHLLKTIHNSGESLLDIFNDILDFSRIEADKMRLVEDEFNLWSVIEDSVELFGELCSKKDLDLVCDISPELPELCRGDASRLRQILVNLVGNATKFTERGEVRVVADIVETLPDNRVLLKVVVSDTGPGIDHSSQESIFEAFTQRDESSSRNYGGAGLGLSIVKGIVELMGGTIDLKSAVGCGTTFSFHVFMRQPEEASAQLETNILEGENILVGGVSLILWQAIERQVRGLGGTPLYAEGEKELRLLFETFPETYRVLLDKRLFDALQQNEIRKQIENMSENRRLILFNRWGDDPGGDVAATHVFMPLRPSEIRELLVLDSGQASKSFLNESTSIPATRESLRLLVAEDNRETQKLMKLLLETQGYRVEIANDGSDVLDALKKESFDLILMDCQMPSLDGLETTRRLRFQGVDIPIIALTAHVSPVQIEECLQAGMNDFISKPFKKERLFGLLEEWTEKLFAVKQLPREG